MDSELIILMRFIISVFKMFVVHLKRQPSYRDPGRRQSKSRIVLPSPGKLGPVTEPASFLCDRMDAKILWRHYILDRYLWQALAWLAFTIIAIVWKRPVFSAMGGMYFAINMDKWVDRSASKCAICKRRKD